MNHRKHKQAQNSKKLKKEGFNLYIADPPDSFCPYCGESRKICSYVNSLSRSWGRSICKKKNNIK